MVGLKKQLTAGISGLALLLSISLCSPNQKFKKENLAQKGSPKGMTLSSLPLEENKTLNYLTEDTIKTYGSGDIFAKRKEFVENARKYFGAEYIWGGRLTKMNPGLDCLGLIFLPYAETFNKKWTEISVNPSEIIEKKQLGKQIKGLDGILTENIDFSKLEEGDIIYLLAEERKINDKPLAEINGKKYWPWHTGIYSNKEKNLFLHANPGAYPRGEMKVVEYDFKEILKDNDALFVTRIY